ENLDVLRHFADFLERKRDDPRAEEAARRILALVPGDAEALRLRARVAVRAARWDDVLAHTEGMPETDLDAQLLRVQPLTGLHRDDEADELLDRIFAAHPTPKVAFALARRAIEQAQTERAKATLAKIDPKGLGLEDLGRYHLLLGYAFETAGKAREAILEFSA